MKQARIAVTSCTSCRSVTCWAAVTLVVVACTGILRLSNGEVVKHFSACGEHFYQNTPPKVVENTAHRRICQTLGGESHYATLYDTTHRVPVFSAYQVPLPCKDPRPNPPRTWYVEPQLGNDDAEADMALPGVKDAYASHQAVNRDYEDTSYERGQLNPRTLQCDGALRATTTLTNTVPLDQGFQRGPWKHMEDTVRRLCDTFCHFHGARRYVVTGAVFKDTSTRIPTADDQQPDNIRELERVAVPSIMWSAVHCDSSRAKNQDLRGQADFSVGYYGQNQAQSSVKAVSVWELNIILGKEYKNLDFRVFNGSAAERTSSRQLDILQCAASAEKLRRLASAVQNEVIAKVANLSEQNCHIDTRRAKLLGNAELAIRVTLPNATEFKYFDKFLNLRKVGCSPVAPTHPVMSSPNDKSLQCEVESKSQLPNYTVGGDQCVGELQCGRHQDTSYSWCYTTWDKTSWDYCCENYSCGFYGKDASWCPAGDKSDKASHVACLAGGVLRTVTGRSCRPGHQCGLHGWKYSWCYTDSKGGWGHCCAPWHTCGNYGETYKWCWTGTHVGGPWSRCD